MTNKMKVNAQTVYTTLPGSSTLELISIQYVPVYEPAQRGWIDYVIHESTITTINENGDVERWNVDTGHMERWYTRPTLENVVTMKVGGYYYEFAKDGSIRSSCKEGTYYWGGVKEMDVDQYVSRGCLGTGYYGTLGEIRDHLTDIHRRTTDPAEILQGEISDYWDRQMDKRWRRNTSIQTEMEMDQALVDAMKKRLAMNPKVYNNEENKKAHEDEIHKVECRIAWNRSILRDSIAPLSPDACSECKRDGVCMCYT